MCSERDSTGNANATCLVLRGDRRTTIGVSYSPLPRLPGWKTSSPSLLRKSTAFAAGDTADDGAKRGERRRGGERRTGDRPVDRSCSFRNSIVSFKFLISWLFGESIFGDVLLASLGLLRIGFARPRFVFMDPRSRGFGGFLRDLGCMTGASLRNLSAEATTCPVDKELFRFDGTEDGWPTAMAGFFLGIGFKKSVSVISFLFRVLTTLGFVGTEAFGPVETV